MEPTAADQVGRLFVQFYYSHINSSPQDIGKYYLRDKSKAVRTEESGATTTFLGRESITQGIAGHLEPEQTRTEISSIVCSELASGEIVVNLVGFISTNNADAEKFTQVFVLIPDGEKPNKRYACSLDIMTYLHHREESAAVEAAEQEAEPAEVVEAEPIAQEEPAQEVAEPVEAYYEAPEEPQAEIPEPVVEEQAPVAEPEVTETFEEPVVPAPQPKAKPSSWAALVKQPAAPRRVPVAKPAVKRSEAKKAAEPAQEAQPAQEAEAATQPEQQQQQQQATQQTRGAEGRQAAPRRNGPGSGSRPREAGGKPDAAGRPRREGAREGPRGGDREKEVNARCIFVKSVPAEATQEQVKDLFSNVGPIKSVDVFRPKNNVNNFQCAVVEFADAQSADACLAEDKRESFVLLDSTLSLDKRHERKPERRVPRQRPTGAPRQGGQRPVATEAGRR